MDYDKLQKISYDIISVTSSLLHHRKTTQDFGPLLIKIFGYASACDVVHFLYKNKMFIFAQNL